MVIIESLQIAKLSLFWGLVAAHIAATTFNQLVAVFCKVVADLLATTFMKRKVVAELIFVAELTSCR